MKRIYKNIVFCDRTFENKKPFQHRNGFLCG
ncbi:hypothetical protein CF65_02049 [Aggregatibacter actinomycetemcomitans HK1651]|nr:hypothetical protein CF65_02049 [Aggregatibacter actinomycetemcomitans HK1651]